MHFAGLLCSKAERRRAEPNGAEQTGLNCDLHSHTQRATLGLSVTNAADLGELSARCVPNARIRNFASRASPLLRVTKSPHCSSHCPALPCSGFMLLMAANQQKALDGEHAATQPAPN